MQLLIVSGVVIGALSAQSPTIKKVPLSPTSAVSGSEMFANYCAVCHGVDGKGNGPAAVALKTAPTDLTQLAAKNQGKFPELSVTNTLATKSPVGAHGTREMPIWGELLKSLDSRTDNMVQLRIVNLTSHVKSLQAK